MKRSRLFFALCVASLLATTLGCSSVGPKKYVFFGEPKPEQVDIFEDYWDDVGVFKPDDPTLPLRRGKGGVIRFFKKNNYTRGILVDGTLTVNVYYSVDEGVSMTQPDAQLVLSSQELNEKYRKFDKKVGYSYNVWLDLGEYDQPAQEITILSIFTDAKSGQTTLSKEIRTVVAGTSPVSKEEEEEEAPIARRDDERSELDEIRARYSTRVAQKRAEEETRSQTRVRESIDLSPERLRALEDADDSSPTGNAPVSFLQEAQDRRDAQLAQLLDEQREKRDYYRQKRVAELEEYRAEASAKLNAPNPLNTGRSATQALDFEAARPNYRDELARFETIATERSQGMSKVAQEKQENGPTTSNQSAVATRTLGYDANAFVDAQNRYRPTSIDDRQRAASIYSTPNAAPVSPESTPAPVVHAEFDGLDDFVPDSDAPSTVVYVGDAATSYGRR